MIVTKEMLEKLSKPCVSGYDSDETVLYFPIKEELPIKPKVVLINKGTKLIKPAKHLIRAHPSKGGFKISVHGVKQRCNRTYLGCKIPGCMSHFRSVRDWNSHHQLMHKGLKLSCSKCKKTFKTPSFLQDHGYIHSDKKYKCEKCDKVFTFKSTYHIHRRTHLRSRIHKCFAGSCGWEY